MRKGSFRPAIVGSIACLLAGHADGQESRIVELSAPRELRANESVELQVSTRSLAQGGRLVVATEQGDTLGVVTPFGMPGMTDPVTATIAIPPSAIVDQRVRLRLQFVEPGMAARTPRPDEVELGLVVVKP